MPGCFLSVSRFSRTDGPSSQHKERGGVRCGPGDEAVVERPKTKVCQPRDEGENSVHSIYSSNVKMSESILEIVLFL